MKPPPSNAVDTGYIGARLPKPLIERFQEIADSEHRSVSGELRRLIENRIAEADERKVTA